MQSLPSSCRYACPICWMHIERKFGRFLPESGPPQQRQAGGENHCWWSFPRLGPCWKQNRKCCAKSRLLGLRSWRSSEECTRLRDNEDRHGDSSKASSSNYKQRLGFSISSSFWCPRLPFFGPASQLGELAVAMTAILTYRSPSSPCLAFPRFITNPRHSSRSSSSTRANSSFPISCSVTSWWGPSSASSPMKSLT